MKVMKLRSRIKLPKAIIMRGYHLLQDEGLGLALIKRVDRKKHFFKLEAGWAVGKDVIQFARMNGIESLVLLVRGEGELYLEIDEVLKLGKEIHFEPYEPQVVVKEKFWRKRGQLGLFERRHI